MTSGDLEIIEGKIRDAINTFIKRDRNYLMSVDIYEPTISHRIAVYLEGLFPNYDVDCEYSKNLNAPKTNSTGDKIRPDIIIHKRGTDDNLCIIEVKKAGKDSKNGKNDREKLTDAVNRGLNYKLGVYIGVLKRRIDICWIEKINNAVKETCELL
ncbi:MAG TPA: hypothetical protein ENI51_10170 [Candidatus Atribacteria bacterium]|nr:hypothetical protein [Candidatus Aerophobetes bacterium]HEC93341.1 hypothetical protein [Candidatus Atribacteria bacterium]